LFVRGIIVLIYRMNYWHDGKMFDVFTNLVRDAISVAE